MTMQTPGQQVSEVTSTPGVGVMVTCVMQGKYSTRLMLVLMGSLAKVMCMVAMDSPYYVCMQIASRCQDLIPRVLLCLNKIVQHEQQLEQAERRVLLTRASELVNILKMPR